MSPEQFHAQQNIVLERAVRWGEMDAFGHVNNTVYLSWAEEVRIAHFMQLGFMPSNEKENVGPILAAIDCRFRSTLTYPDQMLFGSRLMEIGDDRFTVRHQFLSLDQQKLAAEGEALIVCFDYAQSRKAALPETLRERLEQHLEVAAS